MCHGIPGAKTLRKERQPGCHGMENVKMSEEIYNERISSELRKFFSEIPADQL